jgi:hypothetical protein
MKSILVLAALLSIAIATPYYGGYRWRGDYGDEDDGWRYRGFGGYIRYGGDNGYGDNGGYGHGGGYGMYVD